MDYTIEEFDLAKTKIMNYILYKKRTEQEVRNKFSKILEENLLDDIIEYVKEAGYLSDIAYIEKAVSEFINLNNLSRKEIKYKLFSKGISNNLIDEYFYKNSEELYKYELNSAKNIFNKKIHNNEKEKILNYLKNKGYSLDIINEL